MLVALIVLGANVEDPPPEPSFNASREDLEDEERVACFEYEQASF